MECWVGMVQSNGIEDEAGNVMNYLTSDEWIRTAEYGTKQEFVDELGEAVAPLTEKFMGQYGPDVIGAMSSELHQWIRDTTVLWVKNKGAGNSITENDILDDANNISNRNSIKEVRAYYDAKILKMTQSIVDLTQENQNYKLAIKQIEQKADRYIA